MKIEVDLDQYTIDNLVIQELKAYHELCRRPNKIDNSDEIIPPDTFILDALATVLYEYLTEQEYDAWFKEAYGKETK
jgi:hypothetical protein